MKTAKSAFFWVFIVQLPVNVRVNRVVVGNIIVNIREQWAILVLKGINVREQFEVFNL
jgi:hypothetical protein